MPKQGPVGGRGPTSPAQARPQAEQHAEPERGSSARPPSSRAEPGSDSKAEKADPRDSADHDDGLGSAGRHGATGAGGSATSPDSDKGGAGSAPGGERSAPAQGDKGGAGTASGGDSSDPDDLDSGDGMKSHVGVGTPVGTAGAPDAVVDDVEVVKVAEGGTGDGPVDADAQIGVVTPGAGTAHGGVVLGGVQVDAEVDVGGVHVQGGVTVVSAVDPTVTGPVPNVGGVGVGGDLEVDMDEGAMPQPDPPELSTIVGGFGTGAAPAPPDAPTGCEVSAATTFIATNFGGGAGSPPPPPPAPPDPAGAPSADEVVDAVEDAADTAADQAEDTAGEVQETGEEAADHVEDVLDDFF